MSRPVRLVLARHGQTESNLQHALDTLPPGPELTEHGQQQAAELAGELDVEPLVAIYASHALRTQQTAAPTAAKHHLDVRVLDGVQEVHVGELEGRSDRAALRRFEDVYSQWHAGDLAAAMPGGETGEQVLERFTGALNIVETGVDDAHVVEAPAVLLVSHGAVLRLVAAKLATNIGGALANSTYLPNTGTIVLERDHRAGGGWRCTHWSGHPELDRT